MIQRKKRVDLSHFDPDWAKINNNQEDCYILLSTPGLEETIRFQVGLEKLTEKEDVSSMDIYKKMEKFITSKFLGGMIYDFDSKKCRAIEKEEVKTFDVEVLSHIIREITGGQSKKD